MDEHNIYTYEGFSYRAEEEFEPDNVKVWHKIFDSHGLEHTIDFTPYGYMTKRDFERFVDFFLDMGFFPGRAILNKNGPLESGDSVLAYALFCNQNVKSNTLN